MKFSGDRAEVCQNRKVCLWQSSCQLFPEPPITKKKLFPAKAWQRRMIFFNFSFSMICASHSQILWTTVDIFFHKTDHQLGEVSKLLLCKPLKKNVHICSRFDVVAVPAARGKAKNNFNIFVDSFHSSEIRALYFFGSSFLSLFFR